MPDAAHVLADIINPVLAALVAAAPLLAHKSPGQAWAASAVAIAVPVLLAEEGKRLPVWAGHPGFPSGHMAFAAAAGTCLLWTNKRWAGAAVPLCGVLGWALVRAGYHAPADVFGSLVFAPPLAWLCLLAAKRCVTRRDGS